MTKRTSRIVIKNIYYMLAYTFNVLTQTGIDEIEGEEFENIHNLFAAMLSQGVAKQLKQGLYKEYHNLTEDLALLRGKMDINGTIKKKIQRKQILTCEYDELSTNNLFNRIIKTTMTTLVRYGDLEKERKDLLRKLIMAFREVDEIEPSLIRWHNLQYHRNNQSYKMLLNICYMVLNNLLISEEAGKHRMITFLEDQAMHNLFEKFVLEYYKKEHGRLRPRADRISWNIDDSNRYQLPTMNTDVVLRSYEKTLIIDTKHYSKSMQKHWDRHSIYSDHLYQIYTYVKNYDKDQSGNVSGLLLYAKTDEDITPDSDYSIDGNRISAKTIDLNTNFFEIKRQLNGIVDKYFPQ